MFPRQLTIIGVGLLGGSLGLAVRAAYPQTKIVGCGHRGQTLEKAVEIGAIDTPHGDPAGSVKDSDLVVLCTPVGLFERLLTEIAPSLSPGAIVTDVGSTKRSIVRLAETLLPKHAHFVASHPIAGSEKRGVEFARTDLFVNRLCILTPTPRTSPAALRQVDALWTTLGMRTVQMDPGDHDRLLGDISHLPHLLAAALVAMQEEAALDVAGAGFLDTTRIASGDGALWRDIFLDNGDNLKAALRRLQSQLSAVEAMLDSNSKEPLRAWLDAAANRRQKTLEKKLREINPD